jgi:hypothetical protein
LNTSAEQTLIAEVCTEILTDFKKTQGQCVAVSALLSERLHAVGIENYVALGTLWCSDILAFKYNGVFDVLPGVQEWDGHAWVVSASDMLIDLSLLRSAKALPDNSNLKQTLRDLGWLGKGAILTSINNTAPLKYSEQAQLKGELFSAIISGLCAQNDIDR